ncbi:MAG: SDR family oxidoreductase, partial [Actinobacteria bacterium]|nr:SDR family oxidoreductase [Actinomycetota bacterium]
MKLRNKFGVIIGGAVGIGRAITNRLAEEGCNLYITYYSDTELEGAKELKKRLGSYDIFFDYAQLDILNINEVKGFFKKIESSGKKLDLAINNAGISVKNSFTNISEEEWDLIMNVNAKGIFFCCQEEAKIMMKQNYGKIINTASIAGKVGAMYLSHYAASKNAVLGFSFSIAKELSEYNITVNCVCPG